MTSSHMQKSQAQNKADYDSHVGETPKFSLQIIVFV